MKGSVPGIGVLCAAERFLGICKFDWDNEDLRVENINLLKPTGHVMHQQFNIQQLYVLPTLYLCVLY